MHVTVVVVGAGQAGLAMSHHLSSAGLDHVVLERGEVANSWRTERWDSLRLLTPAWMSTLPGWAPEHDEPGAFATAADTVAFLEGYRASFDPPVLTNVTVRRVERTGAGFVVTTDGGEWTCDAVVAATGGSSEPRVPAVASALPPAIDQLTALAYRRPGQLGAGGEVLVVGASSSGVQIADELQRSGRQVTVAVGEHVRLPRSYRGRDIFWWMQAIGQLDERYDEVDDIDRARRHASAQLVGDRRSLDLDALRAAGVRVAGRLMDVRGQRALCSGGIGALAANADLKQQRVLDRADAWALEAGLDGELLPPDRPAPTDLGEVPTELDLRAFSTVVWATGYRPTWSWLDPRALDPKGRLVHVGGVARLPGLYVLGLPFLRRRRSSFIAGVGHDAADLLAHLRAYLDTLTAAVRS